MAIVPFRKRIARPNRKGVTLIMVAAVLAILAGLATGFYTMMLSQTKSATRYSDAVRADMMARAGIDFAIAQLRDQSFRKTEDPTDPWYMFDYLRGNSKYVSYPESELLHNAIDDDKDGIIDNLEEAKLDPAKMKGYSRALSNSANSREGDSDRFTLNVHDAASRINVNACDNLGAVLDSLCRVIGPPLVSAEENRLIPRVWEWYGGQAYNNDVKDWPKGGGAAGGPVDSIDVDIYYELIKNENRPITRPDGIALYGDGYAIAGYRARHGRYESLQDIKNALTYVERENDGKPDHPLEQLEIEVKFAALRDYITVDSWVDITTSGVGKFEWVATHKDSPSGIYDLAVDRDKSWIPDDPKNDPENKRGSLRGCYVAIINGHGAGQLRRIKSNGIDWIQIENFDKAGPGGGAIPMGFAVPPGPTSSYVIIALEDSKLICQLGDSLPSRDYNYYTNPPPRNMMTFPDTDDVGNFLDDPMIDYFSKPLCIHRAPVNVNTASDKVLAALLMGMNVTHGHFMSLGTDVDMRKLASYPLKPRAAWAGGDSDWKIADHNFRKVEPYVITPKGLKRIPADAGKFSYDLSFDTYIKSLLPPEYSMNYLNNNGRIDPKGSTNISEVQELVFRILVARQPDPQYPYQDPVTGQPTAGTLNMYKRGPFVSWDDFYFRVIRPWDDGRIDPDSPRYDPRRGSVARMIMAAFNPNMDILKFNPNIEWIDRWGRNFTEMEPVMSYTNRQEQNVDGSLGHGAIDSRQANVNDVIVADQEGTLNNDAVPVFSRERTPWTEGGGSLFSMGPYGTDPKYMGSYVTRNFRYKSDEMLDKTDLNRSSTEFSFDSRGIYEITSTGQVARRGEVMAERKLQALVKVYDVWSESTQRDFVKGYISRAADNPAGPSNGTTFSGSIGRDSTNQFERLALSTLPEPLVPLKSTIDNPKNIELVDTALSGRNVKHNAWGQEVPMNVPDVVANRVLPAGYDGQIALATNTQAYRPEDNGDHDTFLATFDGDLDTKYSKGNGREQAKTPLNGSVRVLDTVGLLGLLNDPWIDTDPGLRGLSSGSTPVKEDLPPYTDAPLEIYRFKVTLNALRGLNPLNYWNNVTCRQGDMRTDGVWVGGPGISGNDGVMKYLCGDDDPGKYDEQNLNLNGKNATRLGSADGGDSGTMTGLLISMWAKTSWHHNDNRNHEFFDCTTPGWADGGIRAKAFWIRKQGIVQFSASESGGSPITIGGIRAAQEDATWGISGTANRVNDLMIAGEYDQDNGDRRDPDYCVYLHGGESGVPYFVDAAQRNDYEGPLETSAYFVQPFRWQFVGGRINLPRSISGATNEVNAQNTGGAGKSGVWRSNNNQNDSRWMAANVHRPFVDSERNPEGKTYSSLNKYWGVTQIQGSSGFTGYQNRARKGDIAAHGEGGQPVRYKWASPGGEATADGKKIYDHVVFGLNNCNPGRGYGNGAGTNFTSIYRAAPEEGTYAVIDEYKISRYEALLGKNSAPTKDRITRKETGEMTLSRYYLPQNPSSRGDCPTFTSQTMLQSLRGSDKKTQKEPDYVTLARVNWTAFTPRFMHADKEPDRFKMPQRILNGNVQMAYRGPFNYRYYNSLSNDLSDLGQPREYDEAVYNNDVSVVPYRCARPTPAQYLDSRINPGAGEYLVEKDYHATRGVEVELLEDTDDYPDNGGGTPLGKNTPFTNPNKINQLRDGGGNPIKVRADRLRYRVRFRYPIDRMVDPAGGDTVNPETQYLVDTPIFDDISITYFTKPRILDYKDLME